MENELAMAGADGYCLSQIERVVDTYIAPRKTFTDILRSASWWLPMVLMVVSSLASAIVVDRQVGFERIFENQLRNSPKQQERMDAMTPEQRAQSVAMSAKITKGITYAVPFFLLGYFALYSLLVWAAANFGLGAQTQYKQIFALTLYAALPYLILTIVSILTVTLGGNAEAYDYKNPVGTNPAYYMTDASPLVRALLGAFDVIKLWSTGLEVVGLAVIAKKTIGQSLIVVGGLWLLGLLFQLASALAA